MSKTTIRFYHLQKQTIEEALPQIAAKAYKAGHRCVIKLRSKQDVHRINEALWVFQTGSFIPHGSEKDGNAQHQPIWITDKEENPNQANTLIVNGIADYDLSDYTLCCDIFDGKVDEDVQSARKRWAEHQKLGHNLTYWYQDESGQWVEKQKA